MTPDDFRRIALGMSGAIEKAHMGHPDFRVDNRIFATLHDDGVHGMVKLTPDQQRRFLKEHRAAFVPAAGAWGLSGSTLVRLASIEEDVLGEAMTLAWQDLAVKGRVVRPVKKKPSTSAPAGKKRKR